MKILIAFLFLFSLSAPANEHKIVDYDFPNLAPYTSTALAAAYSFFPKSAELSSTKDFGYSAFPERQKKNFLEGSQTRLQLLFHKGQEKPLVFVLSGMGGSSVLGSTKYLSHWLYKEGYHVIAVPSSFHWKFNASAISSGLPGYLPQDSKDMYESLKTSYKYFNQAENFKVSQFHLLGYSLGGLTALFINQQDQQEKAFNFSKVIAINPPVDMRTSTNEINRIVAQYIKLPSKYKKRLNNRIWNFSFKLGDSFKKQASHGVINFLIENKLPFSDREFEFLVGKSFHDSLSQSIFVSEIVQPSGLFPIPSGSSPAPGLAAAAELSLMDYFEKLLIPYLKEQNSLFSLDTALDESSMTPFANQLQSDENIFVFHNLDDPIISTDDVSFLKDSLPPHRLRLYPQGGHLGNLWMIQNKRDILEALK